MKTPLTIYVVDDDPGVLSSLGNLLRASHFTVRPYGSSQLFLDHYDASLPGCVICDLAMPDVDGLEVQRRLKERGSVHPIIFISGRDCVPGSVQALKQGAADFLTKPIHEDELLAAVAKALAQDADVRDLQERLAELTEREREVAERIATGQLNKQIGLGLGVCERTVKFHRGNLLRKLGISTTAQIVHLVIAAGLIPRPLPPLSKPEALPDPETALESENE